jgi:DNA primase large subunit
MTQEDRVEFKENDNISHFICRLSYCRNEELRRWFLTQETRLFNIRLSDVNPNTVKQLLESKCGIIYNNVHAGDADWEKFKKEITFKSETTYKKDGGASEP